MQFPGQRRRGHDTALWRGQRGQRIGVGKARPDERQPADAEAGQVGRGWNAHGPAQRARQKLRKVPVARQPAVYRDGTGEGHALVHCRHRLRAAQRHAFEYRAHQIALAGFQSHSQPHSGGGAVPVGAGETGERGHESQSAFQRRRSVECGDVIEMREQTQTSRPVQRRCRVVHAAVDGIGWLRSELPCQRGQNSALCSAHRTGTGYRQREGAGAKRDLGLPRTETAVAEQRGLLIDDACHQRNPTAFRNTEPADGRAYRGQQFHRHTKQPAQVSVPFPGGEIHQTGARGGDDIGGIFSAQPVEEKCIAGAKPQSPALRKGRRSRHVIQNPAQFRRRKIRIKRQPGALQRERFRALGLKPVDDTLGAVVLPDDGVAHRRAAVGVPGDDGLALIGDASRADVSRAVETAFHRREQFARIVLNPAGLRIDLTVLDRAQVPEFSGGAE